MESAFAPGRIRTIARKPMSASISAWLSDLLSHGLGVAWLSPPPSHLLDRDAEATPTASPNRVQAKVLRIAGRRNSGQGAHHKM